MATKKELTEKQETFLNALFGAARGDIREAMRLAGYADTTPQQSVISALKEEIIERSTNVLAGTAPKAAFAYDNVINDPSILGAKELMTAAKEVLDRVGITKVERVDHNINTPNGLLILPPKDNG